MSTNCPNCKKPTLSVARLFVDELDSDDPNDALMLPPSSPIMQVPPTLLRRDAYYNEADPLDNEIVFLDAFLDETKEYEPDLYCYEKL